MTPNNSLPNDELTESAQADAIRLAEWAESDFSMAPESVITHSPSPGAGQSLLEAALGSSAAVKRAVGKPSLSKSGTSPSRSIRLPKELDAQLVALSARENRKPSDVVRAALVEYLAKVSH
ncbi:hypothetical protein ART_3996 [Arthrobacter sp. PAMC 25486]|uniref:hypothetical protein n=1 Tax=Arthrobacter sp. PAMC 25486 TaxID=1494608 RepID=UPI0005363124|nr:hypothetical protein [Arthrobacter sp. PAMC 25486]AIY03595.1 hypothetical protein ART_3996 [Arthrobacter sp. PAMC 25486]